VFLSTAAVVIAILAWLTFRRATTPWSSMPDADYWGNISGLITETGVKLDLAALFHHNNEHIVPIPKLVYAANYLLTSGSNTGLIVYSLLVGAACTLLLLLFAKDVLGGTPPRLLLCAVLFPLVMFSAKLTHSYFLGMSGAIWLTADLFVIASAACFAKAITTERPGWLIGALTFGILGVLAYSTAVYILLVLLIYCLAKLWRPTLPGPSATPALVGTIATIVIVLGLGLANRNQPASHPEFQFDILGLGETASAGKRSPAYLNRQRFAPSPSFPARPSPSPSPTASTSPRAPGARSGPALVGHMQRTNIYGPSI